MWGITDMPNANFSSIYNPESDVLGKVQYQKPYFLLDTVITGNLINTRNGCDNDISVTAVLGQYWDFPVCKNGFQIVNFFQTNHVAKFLLVEWSNH